MLQHRVPRTSLRAAHDFVRPHHQIKLVPPRETEKWTPPRARIIRPSASISPQANLLEAIADRIVRDLIQTIRTAKKRRMTRRHHQRVGQLQIMQNRPTAGHPTHDRQLPLRTAQLLVLGKRLEIT